MKSLPIIGWKKSLEEIVRSVSISRPIPILNDNAISLSPLEIRRFVREMRRQRGFQYIKEAKK